MVILPQALDDSITSFRNEKTVKKSNTHPKKTEIVDDGASAVIMPGSLNEDSAEVMQDKSLDDVSVAIMPPKVKESIEHGETILQSHESQEALKAKVS